MNHIVIDIHRHWGIKGDKIGKCQGEVDGMARYVDCSDTREEAFFHPQCDFFFFPCRGYEEPAGAGGTELVVGLAWGAKL